MRFCNSFILLVILLSAGLNASAQSTVYSSEIKADGKIYETILNPSTDSQVGSVELYFYSKGNNTYPIDISVEGPAKTKFQVKSSIVKGEIAEKPYALSLKTSGAKKSKTTFVLKAEPVSDNTGGTSNGGGSGMPGGFSICDLLPASEIKSLLEFYRLLLGRNVTREELCSGGDIFNPTSDPANPGDLGIPDSNSGDTGNNIETIAGGLQISGLFLKDACKPDRTRYLTKLIFDLSEIDPALRSTDISIKASVSIRPYKGDQAASLKPTSEGRFAPAPLLLMSSLGGFFPGSESIQQITWKKNGYKSKPLKVYDYVFYKGMILTRTPLSGLNGGKATFVLKNDYNSYGICFKLKRSRQKTGGYP